MLRLEAKWLTSNPDRIPATQPKADNLSRTAEGFVDVANSGDSFSYDPVSTDATLDGFLGLVPMRLSHSADTV